MKILHIITSLGDGGAEGVLYKLCCNDFKNEHVVVSLIDQGKYGKLLLKNQTRVYTLDMKPEKFSVITLFKLIKILKKEKPKIVQTWLYHADFFGSIAAKLAGVKNIIWNVRHSDFDKNETKKSLLILVKILAKLSYIMPKKIIFCSKRSIKIHKNIGYDKKKSIYIANGYDLKKFTSNPIREKLLKRKYNLSKKVPILGNVARFHPKKDHKNLLQALYFLKKNKVVFKCVLVGLEINKKNKQLVEMIKNLKLQNEVILLGTQKNINIIMNVIDIYVMSSKYGEAFPNVVAEAMACGAPCVVTDVGDASLIVDKTGWTVQPNNSKKLAVAIQKALINLHSNKGKNIRLRARKRIYNEFTVRKMVDKYCQLWEENFT